MNLAHLFHTHWLNCPRLNELLAVGRVLTGALFNADPGQRYATITLPGSRSTVVSGFCSPRETITVRVRIHHDDRLLGQMIVQAALYCFDGWRSAGPSPERQILVTCVGEPREMQNPRSGHWDWVLDFHCRVQ